MKTNKILLIAVAVLAVAVIVLLARNTSAPTAPENTTGGTTPTTPAKGGSTTSKSTTGGTTTAKPTGGTQSTTPKPSSGIAFLAPTNGAQWIQGELHEIKWSREAGLGGYLSLLDASTKKVVGVITPSLSTRQTSMQWDTQNISLGRTNPTRTAVPVGSYVIRATFDGPIASVDSPAFSVIYASQAKATTHTISLNKFVFDPTSVRIARGQQLIFTNKDTIAYTFYFSSLRTFTLAPGASETYNTLGLSSGIYDLYSDVYTSLKASIIVE